MMENRYDRQIRLKEFGPEAQQKLSEARVLVVGAGGLGLPVLQYLNSMGVGTLGIAEQDVIERSNLHRQPMYADSDIGSPKIEVVKRTLSRQNPETIIITHDTFLVKDNALDIIESYDLVVDASDNFATRYLVNDSCVILKKPFVYGALHGFEGQVSVFNYKKGPTYRCLFPHMPEANEVPDCNEHGVLGVIPGIVGNLQAMEAVKLITGIGESLSGTLLIYNGLSSDFYKISIPVLEENKKINTLAERYEFAYCDPTEEINADEFKDVMDSSPTIQLIDVRTDEEYRDFHFEGSVNIPLALLHEHCDELDESRPVYLVCQSGARSLMGLQILKEAGFSGSAIHLKGGLIQYKLFNS